VVAAAYSVQLEAEGLGQALGVGEADVRHLAVSQRPIPAARGPTPRARAAAASVNTPEPKSCQLAGKTAIGASVKKFEAWVARRMAFQPIGPTAVATRAVTTTEIRLSRSASNTATAATARLSPAPPTTLPRRGRPGSSRSIQPVQRRNHSSDATRSEPDRAPGFNAD
jgi:hypothetical protein